MLCQSMSFQPKWQCWLVKLLYLNVLSKKLSNIFKLPLNCVQVIPVSNFPWQSLI